MKHFFIIFSLIVAINLSAQDDKPYFQLPIVPESITHLQERSDYLVKHYWDFCDLSRAFSARDKMADSFDTYLSLMLYASADVVFESVDDFMKKISKKPDDVLFIAEQAEAKLYSDTAIYASDELYLRFLNNITKNKKIDKTLKLRYQHQQNVLSQSQIGMQAPEFEYIDIDSHKGTFCVDSTNVGTLLFFNDPDCSDCTMARIRLDADIQTSRMSRDEILDIISIYPGDASNEEWKMVAGNNPASWRTIASEFIDEIYDLRHSPMFYLLNPNGKILLKTGDVNIILDIMSRLGKQVTNIQKPASSSETNITE